MRECELKTMSHLNYGLISAYNSLTDKHLAGYFSSTRIRRHLQRAGLITRSGRIVPDKEYRHRLIQRAHQRHVRESLAQAIFHKVLEMERAHQIEIKRKLEEFARRERVHKIKVDRSKRYEEDIIRILSPRPPTGARGIRKQHSGPEGEHSESSDSPGSSRPNTAPGKMQRPVRLKPIHTNGATASLRRSAPYRLLEPSNKNDCTMDKESRRRLTTMEASRGISPYCLPVINNFVTPVPPATKRVVKVIPSGTLRGRRLRPTTATSGADVNEDPPMLRSSVHQSRVCVKMVYFGKTVRLSNDLIDVRDEVKVFQQHCGGENLCVYKGLLHEGDTFQFISRRHRGFPFSLTFFLNGLQVERLSSCCEFKHRKGSRLGGRHGHFGFSSVEGASPCYKCIIAMGLDKKPTPPPKRVKEDGGREKSFTSPKDDPELETEMAREGTASHSECETSLPQDMETHVKEEIADEEDKVRNDYEEDFEADDEGPAEEKKSPSPSGETERQVTERDASETEDDEKDEDIKSHSGSSSSGSNQEESDAEATNDSREDKKAEQPKEVDQEETAVFLADERDEPNPKEVTATEAESPVPKDSDIQNSAWESTEIDISDASIPSGNNNKLSDDISGDKEVEEMLDERKQEEEQVRAKSVQEKLAEAILKEYQCSSEPELSDTSTEEEEESIDKGHNKDAVPEKSLTFTEEQTPVEETKCEEGVVEGEVVQEHETEQEPCENNDGTKDEMVKIDENINTAENDKSEDTDDTGLHPVREEEMAEDGTTSEPHEDTAAESTDAEAAKRGEENEEKTAVEADVQPDKTGQGAKSSEEDESSVSEPNKETDETAVPDNAEAEAMTASETMEMKAEPSEEGEALNCEEAPVADTEKRQQGHSEDRAAASETEVSAETSSSSLEGSADTTVEKTADTSEDSAKDESSKDDIKEEEAEEVSAVEASKDDNQEERCDVGEEQTERSVETYDRLEEKSEEEGKEEENQTNADELTEGDNYEEREWDDKDKTEEENNENKTEGGIENLENILEWTKTDSNTETKVNEEQAEKPHSKEDEDKADESEKAEKDQDGERVQDECDKEESEEKGATSDETNEGEKTNETNTAADEERDVDADKEEKDQNENEAEQSEAVKNKDDEESKEKNVNVEAEQLSEIVEEPEESADADLDKDNVKICDANNVVTEDVGDSEAANLAHWTKMTEETLNNTMEANDVNKETERRSDNIDAENGEISTRANSETHEDADEAQTEGKRDVKTAENTEDERETEEPLEDESTEVKEVTAESGEGGEKHEDDKFEQALDTDMAESEAQEGDDYVEKQDESAKPGSQPDTSGTEIKEESKSDDGKDGEETKQKESGDISDPDHENRDSDGTKKNDNSQINVSEVIVASSGDQAQSSTPKAVDLDITVHELDESTSPSDCKADEHPHTDESAAAADLSATDGDNGADMEDASKASEEGASVLLKPQEQSAQLTQNNEADNTEESAPVGEETPEASAREDNTDLVTDWVTTHQTSKFFETFVEPLEDLKESPSDMQEHAPKDVNESGDKAEEEAGESDHSEDGEPCEDDAATDTQQVEEGTAVTDFIQKTESEQNDKESVNGQDVGSVEHQRSRGSLEEDTVQEGLMEDNAEQTDISKTEVESMAGTPHSVTSGRPESVSENQTEEKRTDDGPDLNEKPAAIEKHREHSSSPEELSEPKANELRDTEEEAWEQSRQVTEIADFTASKSEDGSQEEARHEEIQPTASDMSISGDRRDVQLIQDIAHTLSKDRLSTFSVDETLFGQSSYPLLTAVRTESGH
ncbi:glutamate-rich protein 3 [Micropterus salmoides]|uniref:glutamate-rich protein 3 n=1 Tax=Micropterus salmoides TaxID=27706 RepID=UPI0018EE1FDE|nr:glutamate-rich protein 3 [Micropterus salmoides]